ncbi:MAG: 2Fe-2S iron-sulfur cluster binding domain-containing protein [Bacteroidota bacterium]
MPNLTIGSRSFSCPPGRNLLQFLQEIGFEVYNGKAKNLNCKGRGTCGTCSVRVLGPLSEMNEIELKRMKLPPHNLDSGLRLSCQVKVEGDISVKKLNGFWGNNE